MSRVPRTAAGLTMLTALSSKPVPQDMIDLICDIEDQAAASGARHDVPDLDADILGMALDLVDEEDARLGVVGRGRKVDRVVAEYARLSPEPAPPALFPGYPLLHPGDPVYPTREDIEG